MEKQHLIKKVIGKYSAVSSVPGSDLTKSKYLPLIFEKVTTTRDLEVLSVLPNTPSRVAELLSINEKDAAIALNDLYMRGFIWREKMTTREPRYVLADVGILMDSVLFDPRYDKYGEEFFDLWKKYWNEEHVYRYQPDNVFRTLPIEEAIEDTYSTRILPYESVSQILRSARRIAVQRCACRVRERRCDNPLETCISLNGFADYIISRGIGREISLDEAFEIVEKCEDLGLVHQTVNSDTPDVICNCCPCCCSFLRSVLYHGKESAVAKSRYIPIFNWDQCADCEDKVCVTKCVFGGLSIKEGKLHVDYRRCWGCGLCARACPQKAVKLKPIREASYIPKSEGKFCDFK